MIPQGPLLTVSLPTLIGCSDLLGHRLETRDDIATRQNPEMLDYWMDHATRPFSNHEYYDWFAVSPFDILMERTPTGNRFHIIEFNGTGIGGLTNLPSRYILPIIENIGRLGSRHNEGVIIVAISGKEDPERPRMNKLMHEKMLYVEAILQQALKVTADVFVGSVARLTPQCPAPVKIVLGYMKDLLNECDVKDGQLALKGHRVSAVVNDRFFLNLVQKYGDALDISSVEVLNKTFMAGANKATAYQMINEYVAEQPHQSTLAGPEAFSVCTNLDELRDAVITNLQRGMQLIIKPCGTGTGHGIEFFLDSLESTQKVRQRIEDSVQQVAKYYGLVEGAFPYTVTNFIDTATVLPGNPWSNRKFELRIVVAATPFGLTAIPSIAKISSQIFDPKDLTRSMLINNITASTEGTKQHGQDFILPLADTSTLRHLGIEADEIAELNRHCALLMDHTLNSMHLDPSKHGFSGYVRERQPIGLPG